MLRHQLDELLRQSIIEPVSVKEDIPISSPIVQVSKHTKPELGNKQEEIVQSEKIIQSLEKF